MMQHTRKIIYLFALAAVLLAVAGCHKDNYREICDYKVQLRYDYNEENQTQQNMVEYYVFHIDEYIFDKDGILFASRRFTADRCSEYMNSEIDLPPGRYSVIAIGNRDERSAVTDAKSGTDPIVKVTHCDDMRMLLDNAVVMTGDTRGPCEPLYHGYRTFTVKEEGISRIRVDMVNAHMILRFRVKWKNGASPERGNYYALLENIPSEYSLMPQYIYPKNSLKAEDHIPANHDEYLSLDNYVIHHIPYTCFPDAMPANTLTHRLDTYLNADNEIWGEFRTYRIKKATPIKLIVNSADGQLALPNVVDVTGYLTHFGFTRDDELKQVYEIDILIDGNKIVMNPLDVGDWFEGGHL